MQLSMVVIIVIIVWIISAVSIIFIMAAGYIVNVGRRSQSLSKVDLLIIQITTIGNTTTYDIAKRVKEMNSKMNLPIEIWVVIDEGTDFKGSLYIDRIITVPKSFRSRARYKARALEYARLYRLDLIRKGLLSIRYRVLYLDDDSIPTEGFINDCFYRGDFDILETVIYPRNRGSRLYTFLDYMRTSACLTWCSLFQTLSKPVWIHGEAMCVNAEVDEAISWDFDSKAEDLVYGQIAVSNGFRMGFSYSGVNITSPLTARDFLRQRRRWTWGIIESLHILPHGSRIRTSIATMSGFLIFPSSALFAVLTALNIIYLDPLYYVMGIIAMILWLIHWGVTGYMVGRNLRYFILGLLASYPSSFWTFITSLIAILRGPPERFEVIKKKV